MNNIYTFFDMDEDGFPELTVRSNTFIYVLKYDAATRECFLWKAVRGTWYAVLGSLKVMWLWAGKYWSYSQFNQNGEVVYETFLMQKYGNTPCFAMMLEYAAEEKKIPISKEMKAQGIYERGTGYWYFRVTKEQYNELIADCVDAEEFASYQRQEVVYTYEELFE